MKRHIQKTGIRKYFGKDFTELQGEPLKALDSFFAEYGACIISGCEVTAASGKYDVSAGLVALEATDPETGISTIKVMPFEGASGVMLPLYLSASASPVERVYGDGKVKPIAYDYKAFGATVKPSGAYIAVTTGGGNRFVDAVQDPKHQFATDTEKAVWTAKETPAGAQAKATAAETAAKAYTDTRETAIRQTVTSGDSSTLASAKAYADTKAGEVNTSLGSHTGDNTRHITAAERSSWNAKETPSGAQAKATAAETNAKAYADNIVYAWAKAPAKPSYSIDEITGNTYRILEAINVNQLNTYSAIGNETGSRQVAIWNGSAALWQFYSGGSVSALQIYRDHYDGNLGSLHWRNTINGDKFSTPTGEFRTLWDSGNFDPATKADASHVDDNVKHITAAERIAWSDIVSERKSSGNCNEWATPGKHYYVLLDIQAVEVKNRPCNRAFGLIYFGHGNGTQLAFDYLNNVYVRTCHWNDGWGEWKTLYHSGNFDPATKADVKHTHSAAFKSYTNDGLFNDNADPVVVETVSNQKILFGYRDYGNGQYCPRIGFIQKRDSVNSPAVTPATASIGLNASGRFIYSPDNISAEYDIYHSGNFNPASKIDYTDLMYPDSDYVKPSATNTGSTALGSKAKAPMFKSTAIGFGAEATSTGHFALGDAAVTSLTAARQLTVTSDARDKTNIHDMDSDTAERLIMSLRPVEFNRNDRGDYRTGDTLTDEDGNIVNYDTEAHSAGEKAGKRTNIGFIAQEVKQTLKDITGGDGYGALISDTAFDNDKITPEGSRLGIAYSNLIAPMVAVIQKLSAKIDRQGAEIESLKNIIQDNIASEQSNNQTDSTEND